MKEVADIIQSFKAAQQAEKRTALATVVHVEGSAYRRPGARMLVTETGELTGAISGGCLEGDALRKALFAISQQQNKLVTYDTTDEEDAKFGIQLGCNGIIHILFEPIDPTNPVHAIALLEKAMAQRQDAVLATLFTLKQAAVASQPGTCLLYTPDAVFSNVADKTLEAEIVQHAEDVLYNKTSLVTQYEQVDGFIELLQPPVSLVIVGAGNDAIPVAEMAKILGWHTTIVDGRPALANQQRFPKADRIIVAKPGEAVPLLEIDERTVFVLMTHNYNYDLATLKALLLQDVPTYYIGSLGPRRKLERMLEELREQGVVLSEKQCSKIFGPVGLDLGAETSEEIALSIIAEIKSVLTGKQATSLRDKNGPIHASEPAYEKTSR
ncbi:Xanthine and CO dehydrogenase maturation factor, XdhC/CoxF family [Chitinophaga sp. CF118]|uniref:XdhC family protein n=1 Tax=Chitinophaga sp. CF118 TaxID=1884367 RepID=UPI0008E150E6|nr:XdhC/CoxI family protein [Chitinophaga sp. CF118]SFD01567.1 Xanthine and CO dehydrogenase maturation factor, XdhC/CoxF family [Chitinophaga sp. CF118]